MEIIFNLFERSTSLIADELVSALDALPGTLSLPDSFRTMFLKDTRSLLRKAYNWNCLIKVEILKYDFEVFVVEPSSLWNPMKMESFEKLQIPIHGGSKVISTVSLGLIASVSLDDARASLMERKARVIIDEWFSPNSRGGVMSVVPPTYSPAVISRAVPPSMPLDRLATRPQWLTTPEPPKTHSQPRLAPQNFASTPTGTKCGLIIFYLTDLC